MAAVQREIRTASPCCHFLIISTTVGRRFSDRTYSAVTQLRLYKSDNVKRNISAHRVSASGVAFQKLGVSSGTVKRISSRMTLFYKYGFPAIWFGFLAFSIVATLSQGIAGKDPLFLIIPCVMILVGTLIFKRLVWGVADLVLDGGDYLLVKSRGIEERIALSNIMNVGSSSYTNPPRITLRLISPGSLGQEVAFLPSLPFSINPFARNTVADDLIFRVHNAKSGGSRRLQRRCPADHDFRQPVSG